MINLAIKILKDARLKYMSIDPDFLGFQDDPVQYLSDFLMEKNELEKAIEILQGSIDKAINWNEEKFLKYGPFTYRIDKVLGNGFIKCFDLDLPVDVRLCIRGTEKDYVFQRIPSIKSIVGKIVPGVKYDLSCFGIKEVATMDESQPDFKYEVESDSFYSKGVLVYRKGVWINEYNKNINDPMERLVSVDRRIE